MAFTKTKLDRVKLKSNHENDCIVDHEKDELVKKILKKPIKEIRRNAEYEPYCDSFSHDEFFSCIIFVDGSVLEFWTASAGWITFAKRGSYYVKKWRGRIDREVRWEEGCSVSLEVKEILASLLLGTVQPTKYKDPDVLEGFKCKSCEGSINLHRKAESSGFLLQCTNCNAMGKFTLEMDPYSTTYVEFKGEL